MLNYVMGMSMSMITNVSNFSVLSILEMEKAWRVAQNLKPPMENRTSPDDGSRISAKESGNSRKGKVLRTMP
jgi:hypothetical protein